MRLLLVLLAALLAIGNAQHVNFRRMSSTGTDAGVKADTGYATPVIGYLWRKYRTQLINRVRGYEGFRIVGNAGEKALAEYVGLCLFAAFWYMHIYPAVDAISGWESRHNRTEQNKTDKCSKTGKTYKNRQSPICRTSS